MGKVKLNPKKPLKDIEKMVIAIRGTAQAYNLIKAGFYPHDAGDIPTKSMAFLKSLYDQQVDAALAHSDADSIPELKQIKDQIKAEKEAKNGSEETNPKPKEENNGGEAPSVQEFSDATAGH